MRRISVVLVIWLLLSGCYRAYRPAISTSPPVVEGGGYSLRFIELDDAGLFVHRPQFVDVYNEITSRINRGLLVVVFVHGWKHSAAPNDANVDAFRKVLQRLAAREATGSTFPAHVMGVYIGWRGGVSQNPISQQLSFWNRKNAADEISGRHILKILATLDNLHASSKGRMRLVTIGHSFGARMVFETVAPILVSRVMEKIPSVSRALGDKVAGTSMSPLQAPAAAQPFPGSEPTVQGCVRGFGDLVILVNPAFEASRYHILNDLRLSAQRFLPRQPPLMLIVSAANDKATRQWFPRGKWFEGVGRKTYINHPCEALLTVGNFSEYRTHHLDLCARDQPKSTSFSPPSRLCASAAIREVPFGQENRSICYGSVRLVSLEAYETYNPFLVATADRTVIDDHGGIFGEDFVEFISNFIAQLGRCEGGA